MVTKSGCEGLSLYSNKMTGINFNIYLIVLIYKLKYSADLQGFGNRGFRFCENSDIQNYILQDIQIRARNCSIFPSSKTKNLGIISDENLILSKNINENPIKIT